MNFIWWGGSLIIETNIFYKTTDAKQCLLFRSFHPRNQHKYHFQNCKKDLHNSITKTLKDPQNVLEERYCPTQLINEGIKCEISIDIETLMNLNATTHLLSKRYFISQHIIPATQEVSISSFKILHYFISTPNLRHIYVTINSQRAANNLRH